MIMNMFIKSIFNIMAVSVFAVMPAVALAQESEGALESTIGDIYWDEVFGVVIAILTLVFMIKVAVLIGGQLGKTFKLFAIAFMFETFALIWRGVIEFHSLDEMYYEFGFEILIYIGMLFMLWGAWNAKSALSIKE